MTLEADLKREALIVLKKESRLHVVSIEILKDYNNRARCDISITFENQVPVWDLTNKIHWRKAGPTYSKIGECKYNEQGYDIIGVYDSSKIDHLKKMANDVKLALSDEVIRSCGGTRRD